MEVWLSMIQGIVIFGMVTVFVRFVAFPEDADVLKPQSSVTLKTLGRLCAWFVGGGVAATALLLVVGAIVSRLA